MRKARAAALLSAFYLPLVPLLLGRRLLVFRDAFVTHFPVKLASLGVIKAGGVPFLNFGASHVEPLLPDPNTFSLYPTNLLYFLLSPAAAFNAHLLLHVALAFFGAARLSRRLGASRPASLAGGAAYAFSGPYLSYASAFSNSAAAAAWAPWVAAEALRLGRAAARRDRGEVLRSVLGAGIAFGLQILAGEPAISAWTAVAAAALAVVGAGRSLASQGRTLGAGVVAGALGALLAAPQILPTAAALPLSFRGEHLFSRAQFGAAANVPLRLAEWFFPLLFGSPRPMVSGAFWAYRPLDSLQPYLYSANGGLAGAVLVASAFALAPFRRSRKVLALAAAAILFLLLSYGFCTPLFDALYGVPALRRFRYPVKFLLPFTLAFSALAALAVDAWREARESRALRAAALLASLVLAAGGAAAILLPDRVIRALAPQFREMAFGPERILPGIFRIVSIDALCGVAAMIAIWVAAGPGREKIRTDLFLAALALCLLPMGWPLFVSVPAREYLSEPVLARRVAGGGRLYSSVHADFMAARNGIRHRFLRDDIGEAILAGRRELWPLTGLPDGVSYAFDTDPDGSYGYLDRVMSEAVAGSPAPAKARLLRSSSVRFVLSDSPDLLPGFLPLASQEVGGRTVYLSEEQSTVPIVRAAARVFTRPSLSAAVELVRGEGFDAARDVVVSGAGADPPAGAAPARVAGVKVSGNDLSATVISPEGCVAVFAVTCFRYWKAAVDGFAAPVEIADAGFCGVRVPPGEHRVRLWYDEGPFRRGAAGAALFLLAGIFILGRSRTRPFRSGPAA